MTEKAGSENLVQEKSSESSFDAAESSTKTSVPSSKGHKQNGSFSSFLHPQHSRHPCHESSLGQMIAPALSVAGAHNPFAIGALSEDGCKLKTHVYGKSDKKQSKPHQDSSDDLEKAEDSRADDSVQERRRSSRTRDRFRNAFGRSLSPWRYHSDTDSERPRRSGSWKNLSRISRDSLDVEREKESRNSEQFGAESDIESVHSGITPRNSAFGNGDYSDDDNESESEMETHVHSVKPKSDDLQKGHDDKPVTDIDDSDQGDDEDEYSDFDEETLDNTLFNAGCIDLHDAWMHDSQSQKTVSPDDSKRDEYYGPHDYDAAWQGAGPSGHDESDEGLRAPNVVIGEDQTFSPSALAGEGIGVLALDEVNTQSTDSTQSSSPSKSKSSSSEVRSDSPSPQKEVEKDATQRLTASRPVFERNRCTITLVHGEYERFSIESKNKRRYIVASDGSEESSYAIEWTIGTVLRDGDEMLVVSVMETDTKLDASDVKHEDKALRQEHQHIRQSMAVILARRAVAVLQRTRLAVQVSCQALHARNSRHMFIDMIDFFEPTMCVVGSRGLGSLRGVLLGSFSNYCVQKSPVPVMVARKRLKLPSLPKGKSDVVSNVRHRHMRLDQAMIEKDANVSDDPSQTVTSEDKTQDRTGGEEEGEISKDSSNGTVRAANEAIPNEEGSTDEQKRNEMKEEKSIEQDAAAAASLQEKEKDAFSGSRQQGSSNQSPNRSVEADTFDADRTVTSDGTAK